MTPEAMALQFLRPAWLLALLVLPPLALWWRRRRRHADAWRGAVDAHLLPHVLDARGEAGGGLPWRALAAGAIAVVALAGPSWRSVDLPLLQGEAPLVVALDLSSATHATDLPPSRLLQARAKIALLLKERAGGQVGLVAFADDAFTVAPLTSDVANVGLFLDALEPAVMPVDGSRPGRAIDWSVELLQRAGFESGDVLLLTDAAGSDGRAAAGRAAAAGFRVSVLGMGTTAGVAYRRGDGGIAQARLDEDSLRALAAAGGGGYSAWLSGARDLAVLGVLATAQGGDAVERGGTVRVAQDGGYWLLPALLLLVLPGFRRAGAAGVLVVGLCLPWQPAAAAEGTAWRRPDQVAHALHRQAEADYRQGRFAEAARAWEDVPGADADYNRGNALAKAGRLADAIAAYDEALRQHPGMADAIANRKAVAAALARKPPPGPGDQGQGKGEPSPGNEGDPRPGAGDPGGAGGEGAGGETSPPPSPPDPGDTSRAQGRDAEADTPPAPAPADAARQRAADAAQRERMQRAMEGGKQAADGAPVDGTPGAPEQAADRERRQANEAWLRRVPDDPGGLLRAKFRLEHERRTHVGADSPR